MAEDDVEPIAMDCGSYCCRAGFAAEDEPIVSLTASDWRRHLEKSRGSCVNGTSKSLSDTMPDVFPIQRGIVTDWDALERQWMFVFNDHLHMAPAGRDIVMSEPVFNPKISMQLKAQVLFEKLNVGSVHFLSEPVLPVYSGGRSVSLGVSVGDGLTQITPIYEGHGFPHATQRLELGGCDVTKYLQRLLYNRGFSFTTLEELDVVRRAKEQSCYVSADPVGGRSLESVSRTRQGILRLPDGGELELKKECLQCPEVLFNPNIAGLHVPGIHQLLATSLMAVDTDCRKTLSKNIVLSGGSARLPGFRERLRLELNSIFPGGVHVMSNIDNPQLMCWIGLSLVGSLSCYRQLRTTRAEYEEHGPDIVSKRCPL